MNRLRRLLLASVLLLMPGLALAQGEITGTVVDGTTDEPVIGAQVVIPSLSLGAVSDFDGAFTLENVPAGTYIVEARYIGYRSTREEVTVPANGTVTVDFELSESAINLDEVVVTGAGGPVEKRKLGNSIATIDAASLETAPITTFSEVLQGREPGVSGLPSGGQTGEGTRIRIRGSASLSQNNEPIIYIDGVRANNGGGFGGGLNGGGSPSRLDDINPESVERVEILKGAAAATLYGSEASNGVIQIFTKQGSVGAPRFTFTTSQSAISYPEAYDANAGFARTRAQADTMSAWLGSSIQPFEVVEREFMEDLYETGYAQTYSASVSGGSPGITYFVSGRWMDEDGPFGGTEDRRLPTGASILAEDVVQRGQFTASLNIFPTDRLQFRVTSAYTDMFLKTLDSNNNIFGVPSLAQFSKPERVKFNNQTGTSAFATVNEAMQQVLEQNVNRYVGSLGANYRPLDNLTLDATFGVDFTNQQDTDVRAFGWNIDNFSSSEPNGSRDLITTVNLEMTFDIKGTLTNQISKDIDSQLLFGTQGFTRNTRRQDASGVAFPGPGFGVAGAAATEDVFESFTEVANVGIFAQEQLGFRDFFFLTFGGRLDASSAFGESFDAVFYPKVSASFIPSDAPFWRPLGPISSLRFRGAVGQSGLQPGAFDALTTYSALTSVTGAGIAPDNLGNPDLKPEISTEFEFGIETGLFQDRLGIEGTYWNRTVRDALVARQFPVTGGFRATQLDNVGEIKGQGVELGLNALVYNSAETEVNLFATAAYLWEQVSDLGGAPPIKVGGSYPRYRNYIIEGFAPGANFGAVLQPVEDGFLPVDLNGDGAPDSEAELLDYLGGLTADDLIDANGNVSIPETTSLVLLADDPNTEDALPGNLSHYLGKPAPDWSGSFGGSVRFLGNFTVSTLFEYKFGNYYVNNLTGAFRNRNAVIGRNTPEAARVERDYATGGVDANGTPLNDPQVRLDALKTWVNDLLALAPFSGLNTIEQADFLRWRELSLTYRVPRDLVQRVRLRNLSFTLAGRNLAIFTKYSGVDPELNAIGRGGSTDGLDTNFLDGVEAFGFVTPRRFTFTMRMGF